MSSVSEELAEIARQRARVQDLVREAKAEATRADESVQRVEARIRAGETAGDPLTDFVILHYGPAPEIEERYREIERRMAEHPDELILTVRRSEAYHGCTGLGYNPRDDEYVLETVIRGSRLCGDKFVLDLSRPRATFPTKGHFSVHPFGDQLTQHDEPLSTDWPDVIVTQGALASLRNPARGRAPDDSPLPAAELLIGNAEVQAWCEKHYPGKPLFRDLAEAAGVLVLTHPDPASAQV